MGRQNANSNEPMRQDSTGGLSKGGGSSNGPFLKLHDGALILSERGRSRAVYPLIYGDHITIGCTTISREAFDKIVKVVNG